MSLRLSSIRSNNAFTAYLTANNRSLMFDRRLLNPLYRAEPMSISYQGWRLFLHGLGAIYIIAFWSYWPQLEGLIGTQGIFPVGQAGFIGPDLRFLPAWLGEPVVLYFLLTSAMVTAGAVVAGYFYPLLLLWPWLVLLFITRAGGNFTCYIWDAFLLEAGFLALFVAGGRWLPLSIRPFRWLPNGLAMRRGLIRPDLKIESLLMNFLIFRLMFGMGMVKFWQGEEGWRDLSIMPRFYANQPIPSWIGFYLHHFPEWFHQFSVVWTFLAEIVAPLIIFFGPLYRLIAFVFIAALQVMIFVSGNYGWFNPLTVVVCFTLLDKTFVFPMRKLEPLWATRALPKWPRWAYGALVVWTSLFYLYQVSKPEASNSEFAQLPYIPETNWPFLPRAQSLTPVIREPLKLAATFYISNPYALFGAVQRERWNIELEGSKDGQTWYPYRFKYKTTRDYLAWYAPGHARLDHAFYYERWRIKNERWSRKISFFFGVNWMQPFAKKLFEGSRAVEGLFAEVPMHKPKYLRFRYEIFYFNTIDEFNRTGKYWRAHPLPAGKYFSEPFTVHDLFTKLN